MQTVENLSYTQGAVVNLYAVWTPKVYKVIYDLDGGTITGTGVLHDSVNDVYYSEFTFTSSDLTLPTTITKTGATFDGWYTSTDTPITMISSGTSGDMTVYAKWKYPITFTLISGDWSSSNAGSELSEMIIKADGVDVTQGTPITGTTIVFTPVLTTSGYTYTWTVDGTAVASSNVNTSTGELTLDTTTWVTGVYDVLLKATKGSSYESYYAQIKIN